MEVNGKSDKKIPGLFAAGDTITARKPYRIDRLSGLSNATTTGYKGAISAGNYLKSL
jgi:thioredoxin reductase